MIFNIGAFFIFLHPKIYSKVWAESVIRRSGPLLVSILFLEMANQDNYFTCKYFHKYQLKWPVSQELLKSRLLLFGHWQNREVKFRPITSMNTDLISPVRKLHCLLLPSPCRFEWLFLLPITFNVDEKYSVNVYNKLCEMYCKVTNYFEEKEKLTKWIIWQNKKFASLYFFSLWIFRFLTFKKFYK